jgi:hypothetical protein
VKRIFLIVLVLLAAGPLSLRCQDSPEYDFIDFDTGYSRILTRARSGGYQVKEEELLSVYGTRHVLLEKDLQFYSEDVSLFFDQNRDLIYFSVRYTLHENQSRTIMARLTESISERLVEKYGENERPTDPYYRVFENRYEIHLFPSTPASEITRLSFKHLERYEAYGGYYEMEVRELEDEEIEQTVDNL